jgi:hypothetical protein
MSKSAGATCAKAPRQPNAQTAVDDRGPPALPRPKPGNRLDSVHSVRPEVRGRSILDRQSSWALGQLDCAECP